MYLRKLHLVDVGPIHEAEIELSFSAEGQPIPTVLLGTNGSGKSVALAVVTNALVAMQQLLFDNPDVQAGRVYKLRSPQYIRAGADHYWCTAQFDNGWQFSEWQLRTTREEFEAQLETPRKETLTARHGWGAIPAGLSSAVDHNFPRTGEALRSAWSAQVALVFPADRHELPAWLNEEDLKYRAKFGPGPGLDRRTERRVVRSVALKDVTDWMLDVVLDARMAPVHAPGLHAAGPVFLGYQNPMERMVLNLLSTVLSATPGRAHLNVGNRHARSVGRNFYNDAGTYLGTNTLLALSSGEAQLFTLFATILMDYDKTNTTCNTMEEVRGIVLIDEADMHLHVDLQATVLPRLIKALPKVQFIITTHSPLLVLGLQRELGDDGVRFLQMPTGAPIRPEHFSEFEAAFRAIRDTQRYRDFAEKIRAEGTPVLLTEGESDARLIDAAWRNLYPDTARPFRIKDAGLDSATGNRTGGAKSLNAQFAHVSAVFESAAVALFDHDQSGMDQYHGVLKGVLVAAPSDPEVRKHPSRPHWAMLLPVPESRSGFRYSECGQPGKWHVEIEHYFSNQVLLDHGLVAQIGEAEAGRPFTLKDSAKMEFAKNVGDLPTTKFIEFKLLFDKLRVLGFIPQ